MSAPFEPGDRVFYRQICRVGHAVERQVPAVFVSATPKRCTIEVRMLSGEPKRIAVLEKHIKPGTGYWAGREEVQPRDWQLRRTGKSRPPGKA